jgi:DNA-binding NtrC family response regulator
LVEDELSVLKTTQKMLEQLGYVVLPCSRPKVAMRIANEKPGGINLLLTDVVMPEMKGWDLMTNLTSLNQEIKCLFMSGYTDTVIAHNGIIEEDVNFIQKPFSKQELAARVREVLDSK